MMTHFDDGEELLGLRARWKVCKLVRVHDGVTLPKKVTQKYDGVNLPKKVTQKYDGVTLPRKGPYNGRVKNVKDAKLWFAE
jgi:hypothetical protein